MRKLCQALLLSFVFATLFAAAPVQADCTYNICTNGDADSVNLSDNGNFFVSGTGEWEMVTRGLEYEYHSHFYLYNDSATNRTVDKIGFYFYPSDATAASSGVCNWKTGTSGFFTNCNIYVCLSDSYQSYCQQHNVDGVAQSAYHFQNSIRFDGFYGLTLEAYDSLAIDMVYEPQGTGSISPGITSSGEIIELDFL